MSKINLREYYPSIYTSDCIIEVPDEVLEVFMESEHREAAHRLRTYRHKAYFSLDREDGIEYEALFVALSPWELYERKVTVQELNAAFAKLSRKQANRIYAHFVLEISKAEIARAEGVNKASVGESIDRGLRQIEIILKKL